MRIEERLLSLERLILCSTKKVLNTEECAKYLNVSADRVRHMVTNKEIPCYKFKGKNYFNREELEATIMQDRQPTQTEIEAEAMKYVLKKNKMEYRILRTETELETGIQHIMNYASADNFYEARSFLYLFLANAINFSCVIENAHSEGFTQIFSGYKSWKFEIVEYK